MQAADWDKETRMTINGPLQVQNTLLAPAQYMFKLTHPESNQTVVSIYNADATRPEAVIIGIPAYRADAGGKNIFTISQPQGNQSAKLKTWFYPGDNSGVQFKVTDRASETGHLFKSNGNGQIAGTVSGAPLGHN
jgi:hypothetical protein